MALAHTINLCSLNVNGIGSRGKRNRVIEWIKAQKSQITFLQETHFDENIEREIKNKTEYETFCSNGTTASRGVAILIKKSLSFEFINKFSDSEGRFILINVQLNNTIFTFSSIYAPNCKTSRNSFFKKVSDNLKEYSLGIHILGGDFNDALKPIDRKSLCTGKFIQPVNGLKQLIKTNKLTDVWRNLNTNKQQFTWRRKDKSQASRLDMIFIGSEFLPLIEWCKIKPAVIQSTDHQSVFLKFKPWLSERGNGYWKINNSVLQNKDYQECIKCLIDKYTFKKDSIDCRLLWDGFKIEVREVTTTYCRNKAKLTRERRRSLEQDLEQKMELIDERNNSENHNLEKEIKDIEKELSNIYDEKARGAQIRSREKWVELGKRTIPTSSV